MSALAVIRPDDWNLPLLVHVFGAMVLVGGLVTAVLFQAFGWRRQDPLAAAQLARFGFRTLAFVALPAWFVMRVGADWIYRTENWNDVPEEPAWLGIGYVTADLGGLLLLVAILLAGLGTRRLARTGAEASTLVRVATVLVTLALLVSVVATWAMSAKPS